MPITKEQEDSLRSLIRESIKKRPARTVRLSNGSRVEEGSRKHLNELDRIVTELDFLRKGMGRKFRKERYTISRCIESIRFLKRKLEREGIRSGLLSEVD